MSQRDKEKERYFLPSSPPPPIDAYQKKGFTQMTAVAQPFTQCASEDLCPQFWTVTVWLGTDRGLFWSFLEERCIMYHVTKPTDTFQRPNNTVRDSCWSPCNLFPHPIALRSPSQLDIGHSPQKQLGGEVVNRFLACTTSSCRWAQMTECCSM